MNLRGKTFLIVFFTLSFLITIILLVAGLILADQLHQEEREYTSLMNRHAVQALYRELYQIEQMNRDYAAWDDSYKFVDDKNPEFIESNLIDDTFSKNRFNFMVYLNNENEVVFKKYYDCKASIEISFPSKILDLIITGFTSHNTYDGKKRLRGIWYLEDNAFYITSHEIVTSQYKGPVRGHLVFGRIIDDVELAFIKQFTELTISIFSLTNDSVPVNIRNLLTSSQKTVSSVTDILDENTIYGYSIIKNGFGQPSFILRVSNTRTYYEKYTESLMLLVSGLFIVGIGSALLFIILLNKMILKRLTLLRFFIQRVKASDHISDRIIISGRDELYDFAKLLNNLLDRIDDHLSFRLQTEKALMESEERYRISAVETGQLVFEYFIDSGKINWAGAIREVTGQEPEDFCNVDINKWKEMVHPDDRESLLNNLKTVINNRTRYNAIYRFKHNNGSYIFIEARGTIVSSSDGNNLRLLGTMTDISKKVEIENDLKLAKVKAEETTKLKTQFLTNMSHELRTPLNAILGYGQLSLSYSFSRKETKSFIQRINDAGIHLLTIINDLLEISRIESGYVSIDNEKVHLKNFLHSVYILLKHEIDTKELSYNLYIDESLPVYIYTDQQKLKQILINLIGNSIKFTKKGNIDVHVRKYSDTHLLFNVRDTGIGIPDEKLNIIFEPFIQSDNSINRKYEGTGLGLSITKHFVEYLGGKIWVESQEDVGSNFHFTIYFMKELNSITTKLGAKGQIAEGKKELENGKVAIIIDDDKKNLEIISIKLEKMGFKVHVAYNAKDGFVVLDNYIPDIVFLDIKLPDLNGIEILKRLKSNKKYNKIPIIAITAYATQNDKDLCLSAGFDYYFPKPIDLEEFEITVKSILQKVNS